MEKIPSIKIGDKIIQPKNPKLKAWRKFLEFFSQSNENLKKTSLVDYTDELIDLVQIGFNREEISAETIENNVSVGELKGLTLDLFSWLQEIFFKGIEEIPKNAENPADEI